MTGTPVSGPSTESVSCEGLKYDTEDPGVADAPALCGHYRDELLPAVATATIRCMQAAEWIVCDVSRCTTNALAAVPPENDARCTHVEQKCPGVGEDCVAYIAGMKPAGRERFAACLADNCGKGLRYCLWDSMVSSCGPS